jgi:hypothetical protein
MRYFLRCMADMTFNLSQTVGRVELPKAATSGFHASLSKIKRVGNTWVWMDIIYRLNVNDMVSKTSVNVIKDWTEPEDTQFNQLLPSSSPTPTQVNVQPIHYLDCHFQNRHYLDDINQGIAYSICLQFLRVLRSPFQCKTFNIVSVVYSQQTHQELRVVVLPVR